MFRGTVQTKGLFKIVCALLAITMLGGLLPGSAFAEEPYDQEQDNADYYEALYCTGSEYEADEDDYVLENGLESEILERQAYLFGSDDGLIRPNDDITRAEIASIFFQQITDDTRATYWLQENPFPDVEMYDSFNNAVSTTTNVSLFRGMPDGTFAPEQSITRAEMTAVIVRFMLGDMDDEVLYDDVYEEVDENAEEEYDYDDAYYENADEAAYDVAEEEEIDEVAYEEMYEETVNESDYDNTDYENSEEATYDDADYENSEEAAYIEAINEEELYEDAYDEVYEDAVNEYDNDDTYYENAEETAYEDAVNEEIEDDADEMVLSDDYFDDINGHWAARYINAAAEAGWVQGRHGLGYAFYPDSVLTRAEAAAMVNRIFDRLSESSDDLLPDEMQTWEDNDYEDAWFYFYVQAATNSYSFTFREYGDYVFENWVSIIPARNWEVLEQPDSVPEDILQEQDVNGYDDDYYDYYDNYYDYDYDNE